MTLIWCDHHFFGDVTPHSSPCISHFFLVTVDNIYIYGHTVLELTFHAPTVFVEDRAKCSMTFGSILYLIKCAVWPCPVITDYFTITV